MQSDKIKSLHIQPEAKQRGAPSAWWLILLILLTTATAFYFAWWRPREERRIVQTTTGTSLLARQDINIPLGNPGSNAPSPAASDIVLTVSGYIITRERIEVSPRFLGVVKWIGVRKGDTVTNNQVLVRLDDAEYQARLRETEGRLANARVAVKKAELDYERVIQLRIDNIESQQTEDDLRLALEAARASLIQVEGEYQLIQTYLDWTVIRSPINGVVLEKIVDQGELVTPQSFGGGRGPSTAVVALADLQDLQVEIDLREADLAKVNLNQPCRVSPEAYPDRIYDGYVAEIAPEANRQKGTLEIKVQILKPDSFLTPELTAKVDFLPLPDRSAAPES